MKKALRTLALLLVLVFSLAAAETESFPPGVPVIVMTHPILSQVKNIVEMYEKDILPLKSLVLLGIYHEDELADEEEAKDYQNAFDYAAREKLDWVRFRKITGRVEIKDLFGENAWTPQFKEIFASSDGIVFTGGEDIPPSVYGQETSLLSEPWTPARSLYEISFLFHLLGGARNPSFTPFLAGRKDFPLLAICLGMQSLNVALGGTLVQDIPSEVYGKKTVEEVLAASPDQVHSAHYRNKLYPDDPDLAPSFHRIRLGGKSFFASRMRFSTADQPHVVTSHHQAVGKLAPRLRVAATSMDGKIAEAVEHDQYHNVLGVQFHPEPYRLFRKGLFMHLKPGMPLDFNPLAFLKANPPSNEFHLAIWKWFAEAVKSRQ